MMNLDDRSIALQERVCSYVSGLQQRVCQRLEEYEEDSLFCKTAWQRPDGGGGKTRVLQGGRVFEKAAVNISTVWGKLPASMTQKFNVQEESFFATGISSIIHPLNPYVPTIHFNYRYFELKSGDAWFGGGVDLTPCYPCMEDVIHLHALLKQVCDKHDANYYADFKQCCDEYFYITHRQETRGVGGLFFDYLRDNLEHVFAFVRDIGDAFFEIYLPIVSRRKDLSYGDRERWWQTIRRGRYVEFNLIYDRGTKFGLETGGQIESILLSLPPLVRWEYDVVPEKGSAEAASLEFLQPRDWLSQTT